MTSMFGQSELGSVLLNEFEDTPAAMAAVIGKYLGAPQTLLHGDIDPLFEDVTVVMLRWIAERKVDLLRDFLDRLQKVLLQHPAYRPPSVELTPERHFIAKFGTLANILSTALRLNPVPAP
jgi:hypothetical protein